MFFQIATCPCDYPSAEEAKRNFQQEVMPRIKQTVCSALEATRDSINRYGRKFCFQLLSFDFIIDSSGKPWLIDVNSNPSLEESCPFLSMIIPRMIHDLFSLTVDIVFPVKR